MLFRSNDSVQLRSQQQQDRSLLMAPFLSGERSTGFRDGAVGAVYGFTRETTPAHFLKSCLEGVSLRLKVVLDLLLFVMDNAVEMPAKRMDIGSKINDGEDMISYNSFANQSPLPVIVASGKAMERNDLWRQMIADSSGLRVVLDEDSTEGTSRGVARMVAMALVAEKVAAEAETSQREKENKTPQSLVMAQHEEELRPIVTSEPCLIATAIYAKKARLQENFIESISPLFSSS